MAIKVLLGKKNCGEKIVTVCFPVQMSAKFYRYRFRTSFGLALTACKLKFKGECCGKKERGPKRANEPRLSSAAQGIVRVEFHLVPNLLVAPKIIWPYYFPLRGFFESSRIRKF